MGDRMKNQLIRESKLVLRLKSKNAGQTELAKPLAEEFLVTLKKILFLILLMIGQTLGLILCNLNVQVIIYF